MRVAIVHDDLVQWGGAERVLLGLSDIYPKAPIFTSVFNFGNKELVERFRNKKVVTSFIQKIPGWNYLYKSFFLIYPFAFEQFDLGKYDMVISNCTRFAKNILTKAGTIHICYCHTPPRFLWHFSGELDNKLSETILTIPRIFDRVSSNRVDHFIAGSKNAKNRIKKVYNRDSQVVAPFVDFERFNNIDSFDGGYFLVISRLNRYKRVDLVIKACQDLGFPLKIVGLGPQFENLRKISNEGLVEFLGNIDDYLLLKILSGAKALIIAGVEDFGLTSLEAQALGKPVIAYNEGGVLETVLDGQTGVLFDEQSTESLKEAIIKFDKLELKATECKLNAKKFDKGEFIFNFKKAISRLL